MSWAFTVRDVFRKFQQGRLVSSRKRLGNSDGIKALLTRLTFHAVRVVIEDVVTRGVVFKQSGGWGFISIIEMRMVTQEDWDRWKRKRLVDEDTHSLVGKWRPFLIVGHPPWRYRSLVISIPEYLEHIIYLRQLHGYEYTNEIQTRLRDYYEKLHSLFPIFHISDIKTYSRFVWNRIRIFSFRTEDLRIATHKLVFYFGFRPKTVTFQYLTSQMLGRLQRIRRTYGLQWDNYYWFALDKRQWKSYLRQSKDHRRRKFVFKDLALYKYKDQCILCEPKCEFIFRVHYPLDLYDFKLNSEIELYDIELMEIKEPHWRVSDLKNYKFDHQML